MVQFGIDVHLDLSALRSDAPFTLHVGATRYAVSAHTDSTRAAAVASSPGIALVPAEHVTHVATGVALPDAVCMMRVTMPPSSRGDRLERLVSTWIHVPRAARRQALEEPQALRRARLGASRKLAMTGTEPLPDAIDDSVTNDVVIDVVLDLQDFSTAYDSAVSLVFHHPELATLQKDVAANILTYVQAAEGITDLAE